MLAYRYCKNSRNLGGAELIEFVDMGTGDGVGAMPAGSKMAKALLDRSAEQLPAGAPVAAYGVRTITTGGGTTIYWACGMRHNASGPAVIYQSGRREYWQYSKLHRTDGPAIEDEDGSVFYYREGKRHRVDGPAALYADGRSEWWIQGNRIEPPDSTLTLAK